jgi:large subunit ribosomal protein L15
MLSSFLSRGTTTTTTAIHRAVATASTTMGHYNSMGHGSSSTTVRSNSSQTQADSTSQQQEFVSVLKLNGLQQNPGAVKKKRRVGRGIGSSKGKTSGRGHKGTKARSGGSVSLTFEGGQTPLYKLLPKRGFTNKRNKTEMLSLNVGTIQEYIDMGRLPKQEKDNAVVWTMKDLLDAGMVTHSSVVHGIKLLSGGTTTLRTPIRLEVSRASESAIRAIEAVGGEVTTVHYNRLALRALLKPHKFVTPQRRNDNENDNETDEGGYGFTEEQLLPNNNNNKKTQKLMPKFARPPPKWQPYYTNWETNRGYLSVQAQMRQLISEKPDLEERFKAALDMNDDNETNKNEE